MRGRERGNESSRSRKQNTRWETRAAGLRHMSLKMRKYSQDSVSGTVPKFRKDS